MTCKSHAFGWCRVHSTFCFLTLCWESKPNPILVFDMSAGSSLVATLSPYFIIKLPSACVRHGLKESHKLGGRPVARPVNPVRRPAPFSQMIFSLGVYLWFVIFNSSQELRSYISTYRVRSRELSFISFPFSLSLSFLLLLSFALFTLLHRDRGR